MAIFRGFGKLSGIPLYIMRCITRKIAHSTLSDFVRGTSQWLSCSWTDKSEIYDFLNKAAMLYYGFIDSLTEVLIVFLTKTDIYIFSALFSSRVFNNQKCMVALITLGVI